MYIGANEMGLPLWKRGDYLIYTFANGKKVNIPDKELKRNMEKLELSLNDAIALWLEDNDYEINEEQQALDEKAKKVKIQHDAVADKPRKKSDKPRTVKVSDAKKEVFYQFSEFLKRFCEENPACYSILSENKMFQLNFGGETFNIDIVQQRKPKT